MNYKKFTYRELIESYTTAIDYSGKADKDLVAEIESRGGLDFINNKIAEENIIPDEIRRIQKTAFSLYEKSKNKTFVNESIHSEILSKEQLEQIVNNVIIDCEAQLKNKKIDTRTIIGSLVGAIFSILIGAWIWFYTIIYTGKIYYILSIIILLISYIIIRIASGKNYKNVLVTITTFFSAFFAIILGLWFYSIFSS